MDAVSHCLKVVDRRVTNPCLANVLLLASEEGIRLMATNAQMAIEIGVEGEVTEPGATSVGAQKLHDLLREWPSAEALELMMEGNRLVVRHGRSRLRLNTISADEFPSPTAIEGGLEVSLSSAVLSEMIRSTQFSVSSDETRPYLTGILFEISSDHGLRVVSTDIHRLSFCQTALSAAPEVERPFQVIVPARTALEIKRLCDDFDAPVRLLFSQDRLAFSVGEVMLTSRLINARYPLYEEVFPDALPRRIMLPTQEADGALRRCLVVADGMNHDVLLHFSANALMVSATNSEQEQVDDFLAVQYSEDPVQLGFNGNYLRDVLSVTSSDQLRMEFSDAGSPVLFTEQTLGVEKRFIVMPLNLG